MILILTLILACYVIWRIVEQWAEYLRNYHQNYDNEESKTVDMNDLHSDEGEGEVIQNLNETLVNS